MDLRTFPFDHQICTIELYSAMYTEEMVNPSFLGEGYKIYTRSQKLLLTGYTVEKVETHRKPWSEKYPNWPVLEVQIHLKRSVAPYVTQYMRSIFISIINCMNQSCVSYQHN